MSKDNLAVKLRRNIGGKIVDPACNVLTHKQNIYFIIDTVDNDADFLQENLLNIFKTSLGVPYIVNFANIGSKVSLVQDLLAMIFLKTHFLEDLLHTKCSNKKEVFRKLAKETNISFLEVVQRFLECKKLTKRQKEILTVEKDLSDFENAVEFFIQCLSSYQQYFKKRPVFYFKDIVFTRESITASLTASFFAKLIVEMPCVMLFRVKKSAEYTILPLEREFCVIRLSTVECSTLIQFVPQLWTLTKGPTDADFSSDGLHEFCNKMFHIHGKTISSYGIWKALLDVNAQAELRNSAVITPDIVQELFADDIVKISIPRALKPRATLSPYFSNEVDRLTRQCGALELDPHYNMPWSFRKVLQHIEHGSLIYYQENDSFESLKYLSRNVWSELNTHLRSMGYRYKGNGRWEFSPST